MLSSMVIGKRKNIFLTGDFNLDLLKHDQHGPTKTFLNTMISNSFLPVIWRPSRITTNTATLLGNIFVNTEGSSLRSGIVYSDISDHLPVILKLQPEKIIPKRK